MGAVSLLLFRPSRNQRFVALAVVLVVLSLYALALAAFATSGAVQPEPHVVAPFRWITDSAEA
jgi:hypothetical protein